MNVLNLKQEGFCYHHAEPTYLMLVYWIPVSENTLPINATHRVCIGAFVMNEKREVLSCNILMIKLCNSWQLKKNKMQLRFPPPIKYSYSEEDFDWKSQK